MSTVIGGFGCLDDCEGEGERGERGKRGKRGHRGHAGHDGLDGATGPTGPTGPTGLTGATGPTGPTSPTSGALLKFSGVVGASPDAPVVSFLADWGVGQGAGAVLSLAPSYPFAVQHVVRNLAVRIITAVVGVPGGTIVFELLRNGTTVLSVTYTVGDPIGNLPVAIGTETFFEGNRLDLQVTATGISEPVNVSATIGVE